MNYYSITKNEVVIKLLKEREKIESNLLKFDSSILIKYELEKLNESCNNMTKEKANKVYDLLVSIGGAYEQDRDNFVITHTEDNCDEWRFIGKLGFGGKYRSEDNTVDCYLEDETPERVKIINELNIELAKL